MSYNDHYLSENAITDNLNPSSATSLSVSVQQNLLSGFGTRVTRNWAIIILAAAFGVAFVVVTVAILYTALNNGKGGLSVSETDVQLLTGWGGGIIGIIGAQIGFRAGEKDKHD